VLLVVVPARVVLAVPALVVPATGGPATATGGPEPAARGGRPSWCGR
jgi:hypothetical protein